MQEYEDDVLDEEGDDSPRCHDCDLWQEYIDDTNRELANLRAIEVKKPADWERIRELENRIRSFAMSQIEHQREAHS